MFVELNTSNLGQIRNPAFRRYAAIYARIAADFMTQVKTLGLEIDPVDHAPQVRERMERLRRIGTVVRNDGKSAYLNRFSPSCEACRTGAGSATYSVSLQCHRSCFYCFNPNQQEYQHYARNQWDAAGELARAHARGERLQHIALTGGEPLLFKPETVEFFRVAGERFPDAHTRLYTCGDHLNESSLQALRDAGLDEIRFSIRLFDGARTQRHTLNMIALARRYLPHVMVEMPVLPGKLEAMKDLLRELDGLDIASINLLEFCFPAGNAQAYRERGYKIKHRPMRVLYNYQYAGGLPVSGSEVECLELVEFAADAGLKIGVHYCSLENKHTSQIYRQNTQGELPATGTFSATDFFIKSAKVFGADIEPAMRALAHDDVQINREHDYLEFKVDRIPALRGLDIEVGISWNVLERRGDGTCLRELRIDLASPEEFDPATDI